MSSLMPKMSPIAVQQQLRRVFVNQAVSARAYSSFYPKLRVDKRAASPQRSLTTTKHRNTRRDESSIDFAYMPQDTLSTPTQPETFRVPLLPDNFEPPLHLTNRAHHDVRMETVIRPEISTTSASGTHIESPSAFSDVTDNHAVDMDVFDLSRKVASAATTKITEVADLGAKGIEKQGGVVSQLINGMIEDVFGKKKATKV